MEDGEFSDPQFSQILSVGENSTCNDCSRQNPRWCSINNAVFLCPRCARAHQKFEKSISQIKSIEVDSFSLTEMTLIKAGGNSRFQALMKEFDIPISSSNKTYKYYTKIAQYYRRYLQAAIYNLPLPEKPPKSIAVQLIEEYSPVHPIETPLSNPEDSQTFNNTSNKYQENPNPRNQNTNGSTVGEEINNVFSSLGRIFNKVGENISNKVKEAGLDEKLNEFGESAGNFINSSKTFISEKSKDVTDSQIYRTVKSKAEVGFNTLKEKANELIDKSNGSRSVNVNMDGFNQGSGMENESSYSNINQVQKNNDFSNYTPQI